MATLKGSCIGAGVEVGVEEYLRVRGRAWIPRPEQIVHIYAPAGTGIDRLYKSFDNGFMVVLVRLLKSIVEEWSGGWQYFALDWKSHEASLIVDGDDVMKVYLYADGDWLEAGLA